MFNNATQCGLCLKEFETDESKVYVYFNESGEIDSWLIRNEKDGEKVFDFSKNEIEFLRRETRYKSIKCCLDRGECRKNFEEKLIPKTRQFTILAVEGNGGELKHFNISPRFSKSIYGVEPEDIVEVIFEVQDGSGTEDDYWGWWNVHEQSFYHIWKSRRLLSMCFSNGIDNAEKDRKGKGYALKVVAVNKNKA